MYACMYVPGFSETLKEHRSASTHTGIMRVYSQGYQAMAEKIHDPSDQQTQLAVTAQDTSRIYIARDIDSQKLIV